MASDYGLHFGFRRSDESVRVSEGRFRTPTTGTALLLGTAVQVDPATPGYLKACAAAAPIVPGFAGILLQEEIHIRGIYDLEPVDSFMVSIARKGALSVITTGAGTKVWFKNLASQTRIDGRATSAITILDTTGLAVGDTLGWNGTTWAKTTTAAEAWMTVTTVTASAGYCEAVLLK